MIENARLPLTLIGDGPIVAVVSNDAVFVGWLGHPAAEFDPPVTKGDR